MNLCYVDSAEQIVYDRLLKRLAQAGDIVGRQQVSLLPVTEEEFNDLASGALSPGELEKRARERIAIQRSRTESMEIPAEDLYNVYRRMDEKGRGNPPPITLEAIWETLTGSEYLRNAGCTLSLNNGRQYLELRGIDGIPHGSAVTVDRTLYDRGVPNIVGRLHFATYGDPVFEVLMGKFHQYELPKCVERLTENVPDLDVVVVAYAAAGTDEKGSPEVRLITSWQDLNGFRLNESVELSETELSPVREQLHDRVSREFDPTRAVPRLAKQNERAGRAQRIMNLLTIRKLLPPPGYTDADNFWAAVKERLDPLVAERKRLMVTDMPVSILASIRDELPYDLDLPRVGEKTIVTLPIYAIAAAVDAGCRMADAMRKRRADLSISAVQAKLDREIEKELKAYRNFFV